MAQGNGKLAATFPWYIKSVVSFFGAERVLEDLDLHVNAFVGVNNHGQYYPNDIAKFKEEASIFLRRLRDVEVTAKSSFGGGDDFAKRWGLS